VPLARGQRIERGAAAESFNAKGAEANRVFTFQGDADFPIIAILFAAFSFFFANFALTAVHDVPGCEARR
jgi:hypothetical protein